MYAEREHIELCFFLHLGTNFVYCIWEDYAFRWPPDGEYLLILWQIDLENHWCETNILRDYLHLQSRPVFPTFICYSEILDFERVYLASQDCLRHLLIYYISLINSSLEYREGTFSGWVILTGVQESRLFSGCCAIKLEEA